MVQALADDLDRPTFPQRQRHRWNLSVDSTADIDDVASTTFRSTPKDGGAVKTTSAENLTSKEKQNDSFAVK